MGIDSFKKPDTKSSKYSNTTKYFSVLKKKRFDVELSKFHLHVMIRVGPYICAEWEWGGLPAWLLKENDRVDALP